MRRKLNTTIGNATGQRGEEAALSYLIAKGYALVDRQWRMAHYEVDLVMQKGGVLVFVEVKTRKSVSDSSPAQAVDKRKRSRLVASADVYMRQKELPFEYRFDIIAITGDPETPGGYTIDHIEDAFVPKLKSIKYTFRL